MMKDKVLRFNNDWKGRRLYEENKKKESVNKTKTFNTKDNG
jgi:hypothetical protein